MKRQISKCGAVGRTPISERRQCRLWEWLEASALFSPHPVRRTVTDITDSGRAWRQVLWDADLRAASLILHLASLGIIL